MEGDLEIMDCEYEVGEVKLINWENILMHNKDKKYRYIHVGRCPSSNHSITILM